MIDVNQILCPVDFSANADVAAIWAADLANTFDAELHFIYVMAPIDAVIPEPGFAFVTDTELMREIRTGAQRQLDERVGTTGAVKVIREGTPWVEIVQYAEQNDIDLIVMGTHGRTGLSHLFIGSVAEKVVRRAPCAVLTIRPEGQRSQSL